MTSLVSLCFFVDCLITEDLELLIFFLVPNFVVAVVFLLGTVVGVVVFAVSMILQLFASIS